jgi:thioredoxin reductase (NADPH)
MRTTLVSAVVIATGCFGTPNLLGVPGEELPHVSHVYREGHEGFQQRVVVVGGGNSAVEAALDLFRSGSAVTLVHFEGQADLHVKGWIRPDIDNRLRRGEIGARFDSRVVAIGAAHVDVRTPHGVEKLPADLVFLLTGFRPDSSLMRSMGVAIDERTGVPVHDAATMETSVRGVYLAGVLTAGFNANRVFIENGRDHGDVLARAMGAG